MVTSNAPDVSFSVVFLLQGENKTRKDVILHRVEMRYEVCTPPLTTKVKRRGYNALSSSVSVIFEWSISTHENGFACEGSKTQEKNYPTSFPIKGDDDLAY